MTQQGSQNDGGFSVKDIFLYSNLRLFRCKNIFAWKSNNENFFTNYFGIVKKFLFGVWKYENALTRNIVKQKFCE